MTVTQTPEIDSEAVKASLQSALEKTLQEAVSESKANLRSALQEVADEAVKAEDAQKASREVIAQVPQTRPHAFAVMPFGKKKGFDGQIIDFNAIYTQLIKPALEEAGFEVFRADEETVSGDILTDMFQELLLADLAIVDMSIDNANVFYELGIRHAFRKRGVVHIQSGRAYMPFDIFNVRTIPYHTLPDGVPDPACLEKDRQVIARVARDTWASDPDAIHSPVFNLLTGLDEPDRRMLRTPLATGFWREYNEWKQRVAIAQRQKLIGDILLLTEEITNPLIKEEATGEAGKALHDMGRYELALEQYRKGLEINPSNIRFRREEAFHLNRLGRADEAIVKLEKLLADVPTDSEAIGYLGRIYKDMWIDSWKWIDDKEKRMQTAYSAYHWLIKAVHIYLSGYRRNLNNTYPGVNALTLVTILVHLADLYEDKDDPDPEITTLRELLPQLRDALLFALTSIADEEKTDYWTLVSLAELQVTTSESLSQVVRAYRKAFPAARKNLFFLQSAHTQLETLQSIGLRDQYVQAGLDVIDEEILRVTKKEASVDVDKETHAAQSNGQVYLFSGYQVDQPDQREKRFLSDQVDAVQAEIRKVMEKYKTGPNDLAFTAGLACGSEILFAEVCVERGTPVEVHLPLAEAAYVNHFVTLGGDVWVERYYRLRNNPLVSLHLQAEHVGKPKPGINIYERNVRWAMYSSLLRGVDKVHMIAFWDGKLETVKDVNGQLVQHMVKQIRRLGRGVETINSAKFLPLPTAEQVLDDLVKDLSSTVNRRKRSSH